jgi:hypothetical protein
MRPGRIVALVFGCLLLLPALGLLVGGVVIGAGYAFGRDDDGYFSTGTERLQTDTVAITSGDIDFGTEPGSPDWVFDVLDADVRVRAVGVDPDREVFIGIARTSDVDEYLASVAHDTIVEFDDGDAVYERTGGVDEIGPPAEQTFWEESASGDGSQELVWSPSSGRWSAILMNADGTPGVAADVEVSAKAGFLLPLVVIMLALGLMATAGAIALIVVGAAGARRTPSTGVPGAPPPGAPPSVVPPGAPPSSLPPPTI